MVNVEVFVDLGLRLSGLGVFRKNLVGDGREIIAPREASSSTEPLKALRPRPAESSFTLQYATTLTAVCQAIVGLWVQAGMRTDQHESGCMALLGTKLSGLLGSKGEAWGLWVLRAGAPTVDARSFSLSLSA